MAAAVLKLALIESRGLAEANEQSVAVLGFVAALPEVGPASTASNFHAAVLHLLFGQFLQLRVRVAGQRIGVVLRLQELLHHCGLAGEQMPIQQYFVVLWLILRCGHGCIIGGEIIH